METVVCSARRGVDARLERMLEARQEMRRRTDGCIRAWVSRSMDNQPMFLLQAIYEDEDSWHNCAKRIAGKKIKYKIHFPFIKLKVKRTN